MSEALRTYAPQARVFAYRYNSKLWRKGEIAKQAEDLLRCIRELPQRPVRDVEQLFHWLCFTKVLFPSRLQADTVRPSSWGIAPGGL